MGNKVLLLKGSLREKGKSATLAEQVPAGVSDAGATVESVSLQSMDIRACDGCDLCEETGEFCVIDDDTQRLYPKLIGANAIVWFTCSAQLKLCIDRWYGLWNNQKDAFRGQPIGIVLTYGDTDLCTSGGINAIHAFESMFRFLEAPTAAGGRRFYVKAGFCRAVESA